MEKAITIARAKGRTFLNKAHEILPKRDNLNLCLTCGDCASGCPATDLENMEPFNFYA